MVHHMAAAVCRKYYLYLGALGLFGSWMGAQSVHKSVKQKKPLKAIKWLWVKVQWRKQVLCLAIPDPDPDPLGSGTWRSAASLRRQSWSLNNMRQPYRLKLRTQKRYVRLLLCDWNYLPFSVLVTVALTTEHTVGFLLLYIYCSQ